jgi:hypothetical protein
MVVDSASMNGDIMTYGNIVADMRRSCLVGDMDAGAILHIGAVTNSDRCYVATDNGIEPDRAFVAHCHIAHNSGVFAEITVLAPLGCQTTIGFD